MDDLGRIARIETPTMTGGRTGSTPAPRYRTQPDDHLGTALLEVDAERACVTYEEYFPYGSTAWWAARAGVEVSQKRYRYTGMEKDEETGLSYHSARYYATWLGRWCSVDPSGITDGLSRFRYVQSSPTAYGDTTGRGSTPGPAYPFAESAQEPPSRLSVSDVTAAAIRGWVGVQAERAGAVIRFTPTWRSLKIAYHTGYGLTSLAFGDEVATRASGENIKQTVLGQVQELRELPDAVRARLQFEDELDVARRAYMFNLAVTRGTAADVEYTAGQLTRSELAFQDDAAAAAFGIYGLRSRGVPPEFTVDVDVGSVWAIDDEVRLLLEESKFEKVYHGGGLSQPGRSLSTTTSPEAAAAYAEGGNVHKWRIPKDLMSDLEASGGATRFIDSDPRLLDAGIPNAPEVRFDPAAAEAIQKYYQGPQ